MLVMAEPWCGGVIRVQAQDTVLVVVPDNSRASISAAQVLELACAVLNPSELVELEQLLAARGGETPCPTRGVRTRSGRHGRLVRRRARPRPRVPRLDPRPVSGHVLMAGPSAALDVGGVNAARPTGSGSPRSTG